MSETTLRTHIDNRKADETKRKTKRPTNQQDVPEVSLQARLGGATERWQHEQTPLTVAVISTDAISMVDGSDSACVLACPAGPWESLASR
jgi:hypothetical protein